MRIGSRTLIAAACAAVFAMAGAAAAQTQAPEATPTAAAGTVKDVIVKLKYDASNKPIDIEIPSPDPLELSKGKGEKAHWKLEGPDGATIQIKMKGLFSTKPFKKDPESSGKDANSDAPTEGTVGKKYGYTIKVKLASGTLKLDPIIIITP